MIYLFCGGVIVLVGLVWLIFPAKKPNPLYGYRSYLAQVNTDSFHFAQKRAALYCLLFGAIQIILGLIIHFVNWDRYFLIWLLTFYFFILLPIIWTEKNLKKFLLKSGELPPDYVDPDKVKKQKTKGLKDS